MDKSILKEKAQKYLQKETHPDFIADLKKVLEKEDWDSLNDRFYTQLEFGTGGLRGVIGGGDNRMNPYNVQKASQGLSTYIKDNGEGELSVAIAYDSRRYSDTFALEAARVFCGNGIKAYVFSSLRPTPELSYTVRKLKCTAGIVVTASHNPPEYNGYKVYWSDGGQIISPHDKGIIEEVRTVEKIHLVSEKEALEKKLLFYIDKEMDDAYVQTVKGYSLRPEVFKEAAGDVSVVYTPLHGTGTMLVERILSELGLQVTTVPEQREPDGEFPTVDFPNPEEASALKLALDLGKEKKARLVMGTDPDADRLGIAVPDGNSYRLITGNQLGSLLADYIFSSMKEKGILPEHPVMVKTIVTTELQRRIGQYYGAEVVDVLTGFKYIADKVKSYEGTDKTYVFGGEESYGYLVGTDVRDKDAVSAAVMSAEMTLYDHVSGRGLLGHLEELYMRHGYFEEILLSTYFKGQQGLETMKKLMESLRNNPPSHIGSLKVVRVKDYLTGNVSDSSEEIDLPKSNVLQFELEQGVVTARPSGTEPKIKFYASIHREPGMSLEDAKKEVAEDISSLKEYLQGLTG